MTKPMIPNNVSSKNEISKQQFLKRQGDKIHT